MVDTVKKDEEVSKEYMKMYEKEQMLLRQGREEGREEGKQRVAKVLTQSVEKLMQKKAYSLQQACDLLDYTVEDYNNAKKLIGKG